MRANHQHLALVVKDQPPDGHDGRTALLESSALGFEVEAVLFQNPAQLGQVLDD